MTVTYWLDQFRQWVFGSIIFSHSFAGLKDPGPAAGLWTWG